MGEGKVHQDDDKITHTPTGHCLLNQAKRGPITTRVMEAPVMGGYLILAVSSDSGQISELELDGGDL